MLNNQSILSLIRKRYSCRSYKKTPISSHTQKQLCEFLSTLQKGPMGTQTRYQLLAASSQDRQAIKGLTTYGFIKHPTGFILGAVNQGPFNMEDFGYFLEYAVLFATSLDLGTVWLGGTFNKGRFAKKMQITDDEQLPAVIATGLVADTPRFIDTIIRRQVHASNRRKWSELFFQDSFELPQTREQAGLYAEILDMVQRAPSASNKQPWRIIQQGNNWHFFIQRYAVYHPRNTQLVGAADMQRIDMGIAMCHFELSAQEIGLTGHWEVLKPAIALPNALTSYTISWVQ